MKHLQWPETEIMWMKNSWNRNWETYFGQIFIPWNQCVLQSEPSLQWLLGAAGIAHQKKKRESCHSTDEKVQTFFFRFSSDAPSEPTHSISFVLLLLLFNAGAGAGGPSLAAAAALHCWCKTTSFSLSSSHARGEATAFYTAAAAGASPSTVTIDCARWAIFHKKK